MKRVVEIRDKAVSEPNGEKRVALTIEMLKIFEENLWSIGTVDLPLEGGLYWVTQNRLRNIPNELAWIETIREIPAQFFIKE